jgi:hypothetical protein
MTPAPLRQRKFDWILLAFFAINLLLITYIIDIEQLIIADPHHFQYPIWPPAPMVDAVHWYGNNFDPLLMARPPFWRMTIWLDVTLFGPFYAFAIYALIKGREWIRVPALVWSGIMFANVSIILFEEIYGATPAKNLAFVLGANAPWLLLPFLVVWRMRRDHPFSVPEAKA